MISPEKFPCTAWLYNNGKVRQAILTEFAGRNNMHVRARVDDTPFHILNLQYLFDSPEAAIAAEVETANLECQRLRGLLRDAEDRRHAAILLQAEMQSKA